MSGGITRIPDQPGWREHRDRWLAWLGQWPDGHTVIGKGGDTYWTRIDYKFWRSGGNVVSAPVLTQLHATFVDCDQRTGDPVPPDNARVEEQSR